MGSRTPDGDGLGPLAAILDDVKARLRTLETASGTSVRSLVDQVKAALANLTQQVATLVAAELGNYWTKTETDNRISSTPGPVTVNGPLTAESVTSSGDVTGTSGIFPTGVRSTGAYSYVAGANRFTMWIDQTGQMGIAPSSRRFKTGIQTWGMDVSKLLELRAVLFRYNPAMFPDQRMDPEAPLEPGFIAEELLALGFGMFVIFDATGLPIGIAYERMVVPLLMLEQWEHVDRERVETELRDEIGTLRTVLGRVTSLPLIKGLL